jgi:restriction system protein
VGIPDFQSLMLPLLRIAGDGKEHSLADARGLLAAEFSLSPVELEIVDDTSRKTGACDAPRGRSRA